MTENQLIALWGLHDGKWHLGTKIHGRHALVSLHKRRLVEQRYLKNGASEWQIAPEGLKILREFNPEFEHTG